MKGIRSLVALDLLLVPFLAVHSQEPGTITGCVSQDASGVLHIQEKPSGRVYQLDGDMQSLQRHVNQQLTVSGNSSLTTGSPSFTVVQLRVVSRTCTSVLPSNQKFQVPGKVGQTEAATPVTSISRADQTTPGFQTESGQEQEGSATAAPMRQTARSPFRPSRPEQAGESELAGDIDAQAAARAEMYPGTTLGVDIKTAPPSSVQALGQLSNPAANNPK